MPAPNTSPRLLQRLARLLAGLRTKRTPWIMLGFGLSAAVAVLGDIVAGNLQSTLQLSAGPHAALVVGLFVLCLVLWFFVTLKLSASEAEPPTVPAQYAA